VLGSSVTTDHISPVGAIPRDSMAGRYLIDNGVAPADFNSYAARRVNHDVMMRGTFANPRLRNEMAPGTEGGYARHLPDGAAMTVFDAAMRYAREGVPLVVIAGADYGTGSSRDWAAKGTRLLGVRVVIAESFERIHRSNLIGMGVLPLQFVDGQTRASLELRGEETYDIPLVGRVAPGAMMACRITRGDGRSETFDLRCRIDTSYELDYFVNGGILPYMLRRVAESAP
jgi:aconitate hydratase